MIVPPQGRYVVPQNVHFDQITGAGGRLARGLRAIVCFRDFTMGLDVPVGVPAKGTTERDEQIRKRGVLLFAHWAPDPLAEIADTPDPEIRHRAKAPRMVADFVKRKRSPDLAIELRRPSVPAYQDRVGELPARGLGYRGVGFVAAREMIADRNGIKTEIDADLIVNPNPVDHAAGEFFPIADLDLAVSDAIDPVFDLKQRHMRLIARQLNRVNAPLPLSQGQGTN